MDTTTKILLAGVMFGVCLFFYRAYIAPILAQNDLKRQYQSEAEPTIILQFCERDDEFWAKVQREQARYNGSGNKWALKQNPVIPYPYNMNFTFSWFGKTENLSTVGMGKGEYLAAALRTYNRLLSEWQKQTGNEFGYDATMAANRQKEFDGNVWGNSSAN